VGLVDRCFLPKRWNGETAFAAILQVAATPAMCEDFLRQTESARFLREVWRNCGNMVIFAGEFRDKSKHADPFLGKPRRSGKLGVSCFPF